MSTGRPRATSRDVIAEAACELFLEQGFEGTVTLLAAEDRLPYERPPLSKDYLSGGSTFDEALVHDEDWYRDQHVGLAGRQRRVAGGDGAASRRVDHCRG